MARLYKLSHNFKIWIFLIRLAIYKKFMEVNRERHKQQVNKDWKRLKMTEPQNAEEIEVTFENKSGNRFRLRYHKYDETWDIDQALGADFTRHKCLLSFDSIKDAEDCAKLIKRSV